MELQVRIPLISNVSKLETQGWIPDENYFVSARFRTGDLLCVRQM